MSEVYRILLYNDYFKIINHRDIITGRLMYVDCFYKNKKIRLINIYTAQDRPKKMQLFKELKVLMCVGFNVIICGDFNTITSAIRQEGIFLRQIMEEQNIFDSFRILFPTKIDFTRFIFLRYKIRLKPLQHSVALRQQKVYLSSFSSTCFFK
uniref:Endonuclease/exonuclease/phosphatase domain-containing protein n=1 Tax=Astyanax mexicanus TaxID=7994 RepID=A0A8B9K6H3_ASTMX